MFEWCLGVQRNFYHWKSPSDTLGSGRTGLQLIQRYSAAEEWPYNVVIWRTNIKLPLKIDVNLLDQKYLEGP